MDKLPFFSVIMPVYNRELLLYKSINSVLQQSFTNFELICINDGSTDNSKEVILENQNKDSRVKYLEQENKGRCIARNNGIKNSAADWICFLDSDDIYFNNHLSAILEMIKKYPQYSAFATEQIINKKTKKYQNLKFLNEYSTVTIEDNINSNPISPNQLCYNKKKINMLFPNENIPISEDWLFMRELTLKTLILKTNIVTNEVYEHEKRTMNTSAKEIAKWNEYAAYYFINNNPVSPWKNKIMSHTFLLCANILLSEKNKSEAIPYFKKAISYFNSLINSLFYKALIKFIS